MEMTKIKLLEFQGLPLQKQLELEEKLLKKEPGSFCLINHGCPPAIVLGTSNQQEKYLNLELLKKEKKFLPVIKRFSGGGTVVIDENTLFVSFIIEKSALNFSFPEELFDWSEKFYKKVFNLPNFALKERDYLIGDRKCGGNAQYFTKKKWLHHTSFLFDFEEKNMDYLHFPPQTPMYRQKRSHKDFLTKLKNYFPDKKLFISNLKKRLSLEFKSIEQSTVFEPIYA